MTMPNEADESNPDVAASQEVQPHTPSDAGGSATLDAEAAATAKPTGEPIDHPIASNFSAGTGEAKTAGASTSSGSGEGLETGQVHLQSNSDAPDPNLPETLPTVDPIELPIDSEVNLPE